jgi:hypothetical protein
MMTEDQGVSATQMKYDDIRQQLIIKLDQYPFTYLVTLNTNVANSNIPVRGMDAFHTGKRNFEALKKQIREWEARVNRKLLGPKWQKKPDERLFAFLFYEKLAHNPHVHMLVIVPPHQREAFERIAKRTWGMLVPPGDVVIQPIDYKEGVYQYVTKEMVNAAANDQMEVIGTLS